MSRCVRLPHFRASLVSRDVWLGLANLGALVLNLVLFCRSSFNLGPAPAGRICHDARTLAHSEGLIAAIPVTGDYGLKGRQDGSGNARLSRCADGSRAWRALRLAPDVCASPQPLIRTISPTVYLIWRAARRKPMAAGLTLNVEARAPASVSVEAYRRTMAAGMSRLAANSLAARSARQS